MGTHQLGVLKKIHEGENCCLRHHHEEHGQIAEIHALAVCEFCPKKRPEEILVDRNGAC
jgi:hypothetical protein